MVLLLGERSSPNEAFLRLVEAVEPAECDLERGVVIAAVASLARSVRRAERRRDCSSGGGACGAGVASEC